MKKIQQALEVSGLASYFADRTYSSYEIGSWKPEPTLFLHAAERMGFLPRQCVVVEDSDVGVEAALAAGMRVLFYAPNGAVPDQRADRIVRHMSEIPRLLHEVA
jgi:beta-phosphoglucomutase-like phosphatase (HAD superfamily)